MEEINKVVDGLLGSWVKDLITERTGWVQQVAIDYSGLIQCVVIPTTCPDGVGCPAAGERLEGDIRRFAIDNSREIVRQGSAPAFSDLTEALGKGFSSRLTSVSGHCTTIQFEAFGVEHVNLLPYSESSNSRSSANTIWFPRANVKRDEDANQLAMPVGDFSKYLEGKTK